LRKTPGASKRKKKLGLSQYLKGEKDKNADFGNKRKPRDQNGEGGMPRKKTGQGKRNGMQNSLVRWGWGKKHRGLKKHCSGVNGVT